MNQFYSTPLQPSCMIRVTQRMSTVLMTLVVALFGTAGPAASQEDDHLARLPAALEDARFQAAYAIRPHSPGRFGTHFMLSAGEFTMRGPIASKLRPLAHGPRAQVVFAGDAIYVGSVRYDRQGKYIDWLDEVTGRAPQNIELPAAFDSKRKQLICLDRENFWYRYDVERRKFLDRREFAGKAACFVYDDVRDAVLALGPVVGTRPRIPRLRQTGPTLDEKPRLDIYSVEGEHQGSLEIRTSLTDPENIFAVWHRGYVILISPAIYDAGKTMQPAQIEAINAKNGDLVYRGEIHPLDDDGKPLSWSIEPAARVDKSVDDTVTPDTWSDHLAAITEKISDVDRADILDRIDELRAHSAGDMPKPRGGQPQVHAIRINRSVNGNDDPVLRATIRVTDTGRPMRLMLAADGPTHWQFDVAEGARLAQVDVVAAGSPRVHGLPDSTNLRHLHSIDGRVPYLSTDSELFWSRSRAGYGVQPMTARVVQAKTADSLAIEVGRDDAEWNRQYVLSLHRDIASRLETAKLTLRAFRASAPWAERQAGTQRALDESSLLPRGFAGSTFGEFTLSGPTSKVVASPDIRVALVADAGPGNRYVTDLHEVYRIDNATGTFSPLGREGVDTEHDGSFPREKGIFSGITCDTKRKELIATVNFSQRPTLFRWNDKAGRWERLARIGTASAGLAYDARHDLFYSMADFSSSYLQQEYVEIVAFTRFGAPIAISKLSVPVGQAFFAGPPQLVVVDNRVVVITPTHERISEPGVNASEVYIVDPLSGKTHFAGAFKVKP